MYKYFLKKAITVFFSILLMHSFIACSSLSSGKKYTFAKESRERKLIEPHKVFADSIHSDVLDQVNPTNVLGIVLNSGYLPYLQEVGRPEVAIFVTTKIRAKDQPEEALLWERVYLNSEAEGTYLVVNKDSYLPRMDITVLPPIIYSGQDITVNIRIIEMDQEDNERMKGIVAVAATAASTFQPQYAGAISIFQGVLNFIIANNVDDIEFQFDFALSQSPGPLIYKTGSEMEYYDMVLNPRINKYALIKTEHRERQIIPFGYADTTQSGLRYGVAEILKFGTLGILNWTMWCEIDKLNCANMDIKEQDDIYHRLLGRPFAPPYNSFIPPDYDANGFLSAKGDLPGNFEIVGNNLKVNNNGALLDYEAQGYLIFSVVHDIEGVDVAILQDLANQKKLIDNLKLNTSQLSPGDLSNQLDPIINSIKGYVAERNISEECTTLINKTENQEQLRNVQEDCNKRVNELKSSVGSDTINTGLDKTHQDIISLAERQSERLSNAALLPIESTKLTGNTDIHLEVLMHSKTVPNAAKLSLSGVYWSENDIGTNTISTPLPAFQFLNTNFGRIAQTDIKGLSAGNYEIELTFHTLPPQKQRHKFCTSLKPTIANLQVTGQATLPTKFERQAELNIKGTHFECVSEVIVIGKNDKQIKFAVTPTSKSEISLLNSSAKEVFWNKIILHAENDKSDPKDI